MVHILTFPRDWEFIVRKPVHKLTVSQFIGIQSQAHGLSIYCLSFRLFYFRILLSGISQSR